MIYLYLSISMSIWGPNFWTHIYVTEATPPQIVWSSHGQAEETSRPGGGSAHQRSGRCRRGGICSSDSRHCGDDEDEDRLPGPCFFECCSLGKNHEVILGPLRLRNYVAPMDHWRWCRHPIMAGTSEMSTMNPSEPSYKPSEPICEPILVKPYVGWFSPPNIY